MTERLSSASNLASRFVLGVAVGVQLSPLIPVPVAIAMAFFAPTYTGEFLRSPLGWLLLVLAIAFTVGGYAVNRVAVRLSRNGKLAIGAPLVAVSTFFLTFPALWIVLLGPAVLILIERPA
jgi:hypothetical protein